MTQTMTTTTISPMTTTQPIQWRRWLPSLFWLIAVGCMLASTGLPYWRMTLHAPQYPKGLEMRVFVNYLTGDEDPQLDEVREIDGLNHYIGMASLYEAAKVERSIALPALGALLLVVVVAALFRRRWLALLTIPLIAFPVVYLADLAFWMNYYGQNLDQSAPLSGSIKPFTPTMIGEGIIGQFKTIASVDSGWYLAAAAAIFTLLAVVFFFLSARTAKES